MIRNLPSVTERNAVWWRMRCALTTEPAIDVNSSDTWKNVRKKRFLETEDVRLSLFVLESA